MRFLFIILFVLFSTQLYSQNKIQNLSKIAFQFYYDRKADSAIYYFNLLLPLLQNNKNGIAEINFYLGDVYFNDKDNKSLALNYYNTAYKLYKETRNKDKQYLTLINIASLYQNLNEYQKVIDYVLMALDIAREKNNYYMLRSCYGTLSVNCSKLNNNKATEYFDMFTTFNNLIKQSEINELSKQKNAINNQLKVSKVQNKIIEDSLIITNKIKETQKLRLRVLSKDKEVLQQEIIIKNYRLEKEERDKKQMLIIIFFTCIVIIIISVFLIIYIKLNREKKRINMEKDKFFSIISHDIKNPIRTLKSITDVMLRNLDKKEKIADYTKNINVSSENLYNLLINLLEWSKSKRGRMEFNPKICSINKLIEDNIKLLSPVAKEKNIELVYDSKDKDIDVLCDENMISTVLRNLISNAIKFTYENGKINICTEVNNKNIVMSIKDNGIGISKENIKKLFRITENYTTKGTKNESGTGLGLILCKEFIDKHKGKFWIESEIDKGTTFYFSLKK